MMIGVKLLSFSLTLILVGLTMWNASNSFKDLSSSLLKGSSRATANSVESTIRAKIALLRTLRGSDAAIRAAIASTPASRGETLDAGAYDIFLTSPGAPHRGLPQFARLPSGSDHTVVSDAFFRPGSREPLFAIAIRANAGYDQLLGMTMPARQLLADLRRNDHQDQSLLFAVIDGDGRYVARSRDAESYVGRRAPAWSKIQAHGGDSGAFLSQTPEGAPVMFAFQRLRHTPGWTVLVGEHLEEFEAHWKNPAYAVFFANLLGLVLVLTTTIVQARIILSPIKRLAAHGQRVAAGDSIDAGPLAFTSPVREFDELEQCLVAAENTLRRQTDAVQKAMQVLAISEHRYRALAESGALVSYQTDAFGRMISLAGWEELTGVPDADAIESWKDSIHPGDWLELKSAMSAVFSLQTLLDEEFRIRTVSGDWRWVRAHGAPVRAPDGTVIEWVGVLEDIHERRQAQEKVWYLAHHDTLTGLHNRTYLQEHLPQMVADAVRTGKPLAIHLIDIDKFKEVNDSDGHAAGDRLLTEFSRTLSDASRGAEMVARLGGDEFVVVQAGITCDQDVYAFGERLRKALLNIPSTSAASGFITVSLGYAICPQDGVDASQLMRNADIALYHSKTSDLAKTSGFNVEMANQLQRRRELEKDLFRAVTTESPELEVHYQPQYRANDRTLIGFEALARWTHPIHGSIPPNVFIAIAEEAGFIDELGHLVLRRACRDATHWPDDLSIAVNLSAVEVMRTDLPSIVHAILLDSGLRPGRLELEVTESVLIGDRDMALSVLRRLKALNIRVAMDDFGTGYSSLEYLHIFPFDKVKIDRVFVEDVTSNAHARAIIGSIIGLGQAIGFETIAEGVETEDQFQALAEMNCHYIQGFLLGKPADLSQTLMVIAHRAAA